jgi:hypothetical protein
MNANELADKLLGSLTMEYDCDKYMEQAATMLRQQQAEINRLKTLCILYIDDEWSGTSSYQAKIDEVNNERK